MELDVGIFFLYLSDDLHDGECGAVFAAADVNVAGNALFIFTESAFCLVHQGNNFLSASTQIKPVLRQSNLFPSADKKLLAQIFFQIHHLLGECGLGNVEIFGGFCNTLFLSNGEEVLQQAGFDHGGSFL